jgi:UDP-N-acetylglucosamine--N-acetylmuramyl-(pentapeptide) pyrophosphoryl-undecaprenol N-acetylglucosamine transferase
MALLAQREAGAFRGWQVLHQCGAGDEEFLREAYAAAGVPAVVKAFLPGMGDAWRAADLAVSRCGAGAVGEVWASGTPSVFLPYPYHRDQHQKWNAQPLVETGGAVLVDDKIEPGATCAGLSPVLTRLLGDAQARQSMRHALGRLGPADGAERVARLIVAG